MTFSRRDMTYLLNGKIVYFLNFEISYFLPTIQLTHKNFIIDCCSHIFDGYAKITDKKVR